MTIRLSFSSLILICVFFMSIRTEAQTTHIFGQIQDSLEQKPLAYAAIALYRAGDSVQVDGVIADSLGQFSLQEIKKGIYALQVRFLGYETYTIQDLAIEGEESMNLGSLTMKPTALLMEEIQLSGRKRKSFHQIDRQVYDAQQFQQAQGGNATDIIRNLPGVSVNALGEISLRGSEGFILMLDGRQIQTDASTLLNQLPANAIQHIELLTTPSAKYDPDGKGGIIHIQTKKGAADGVYLQMNGILGAPSIEPYDNTEASRRFGGDVTVNIKQGTWDLSAGVDYRRDDIAGRRIGYVNTLINDILTEYPSKGERSFDRYRYSGRLSAIYTPKKDHQIAMRFLAGDRTQFRTADILYAPQQRIAISPANSLDPEVYWNLYREDGNVFSDGEWVDTLTYYNENLRVREGDFLIGGLDYTWTIGRSSLQLSALYERTLLGGPTDNASLAWPNIADTLQFQYNTNENPLDGIRLKADFSRKVKHITWESGYQYRFLNHPGDFLYLDRDLKNDRWIENPEFTNRIELNRQIHSLYTQFSGKHNKFSYTAGLRLEYMDRQVRLSKPDTAYLYEIVQPFPNLQLQYELGGDWIMKGGYSRRIERTTTFKMTPFPEREHSETLEQGDAELLPEFIDLVEVGLIKNWGDNSVFATGYFRHVQHVINRVNSIYNDSILNRIYTNAGQAQAIGLEVGTQLYPTKQLQIYLGSNVYQYRIQGNLFGEKINTANMIFSVNANAQITLSPTLSLQTGVNYLSQRVTAQGIDSRFYNPSMTLRKTFLDGKFSASLQWLSIDMGILASNEQRITTVRSNFFTTTNYVYEVDRLLLSLSYQLNQPSKQMKFIKSEFGEKEY